MPARRPRRRTHLRDPAVLDIGGDRPYAWCGVFGDGLVLTNERERVTCGHCLRKITGNGTPERRSIMLRADLVGRLADLVEDCDLNRDELFELMLTNAEESFAYAGDDDAWIPEPARQILDTPPL